MLLNQPLSLNSMRCPTSVDLSFRMLICLVLGVGIGEEVIAELVGELVGGLVGGGVNGVWLRIWTL